MLGPGASMFRRLCAVLIVAASLSASPALADFGWLIVHVVSDRNEPLVGACFDVYAATGNGQRGERIDRFCDVGETDELLDGVVIVRAVPGQYILAEAVAPGGYAPAPDVAATIEAGKKTQVTVSNAPAESTPTPIAEPTAAPTPTPAAGVQTTDAMFPVDASRQLYLSCVGDKDPTVILEAGGPGGTSQSWVNAGIQAEVAGVARTCVYDRAFVGRSVASPPTTTRTVADSAEDLHALLAAAGIACQRGVHDCVFVGSSWGGVIVRYYAATYPDEVSGLVLVDAIPPGFRQQLRELPLTTPAAEQERSRLLGTDTHEYINMDQSLQLADAVETPPDVLAAVMTHDPAIGLGFSSSLPVPDLEHMWQDDQTHYADKLDARLVTVPQGGSDLVLQQPEAVVRTIDYVVDIVRVPVDRFGKVQVLVTDASGAVLTGACVELYTDAGHGARGDRIDRLCDETDGEDDGTIIFRVARGHYVLRFIPPDGYVPTDDQAIGVVPGDLARVKAPFAPDTSALPGYVGTG